MKKLLVLLTAITLAPTLCFAYLDEDETSDIDVLRAQGFSESMLRSMDLTNYHNKGINSAYTRRFTLLKPKNKASDAYTKLRLYFDPIQDDGLFGEHNVSFSNSVFSKTDNYTTLLKEVQQEAVQETVPAQEAVQETIQQEDFQTEQPVENL